MGFLLGVGWNGVRVAIDRGAPLRAIMSELMTEDAEGTRRRAETPRHFMGLSAATEKESIINGIKGDHFMRENPRGGGTKTL
jgi:hypothetical protein